MVICKPSIRIIRPAAYQFLLNMNRHVLGCILRSNNFNSYASEIPCEIVKKLETNGYEAKDFVEKIADKKTPPIIKDLSEKSQQKIQHEFSDIFRLIHKNMSGTEHISEAAITGAVDSFNDINRKNSASDIDKIPTITFSDIAPLFAGFTNELTTTHATKPCLAADSSTSTKHHPTRETVFSTYSVEKSTSTRTASKQNSTHRVTPPTVSASSYLPTSAVSNISRSFSPVPSSIPEPQSANLGTRTTSRPFESKSIGICAVTILGVLGLAVFL